MDASLGSRHSYSALLLFLIAAGSVSLLMEEEKQPTMLAARVGEYVVFNCPLDFPHDYVIPYVLRWNKDGTLVFSSYEGGLQPTEGYAGRISLVSADSSYGKGSINLTNIRESDGGWYECSIFFPNRTPSTRLNGTWFRLSVEGGTLLTIPPINQTTLAGEPAHFACVSKDKDAVATWYKDGVPLGNIPDLSNRFFIINGSLMISPTDETDPGEYTCEIKNSQGDTQTASAYLNVQYKAKVVKSLSEVYLPYGRSGILDCHFLSNPPLTNIRWEKDGFLFDPYNVPGVFYRKNGSLYFTKVNESHSGHYTCTPGNELGTAGPSPPINVIVQRPPMFTVVPHKLYQRKPGETIELPCDAVDGDDNHKPKIAWLRKDSHALPLDRIKMQNGNLTIRNLKDSDRGLYQCVASNEAATISSDTEIMIDNVAPRAPYNLSATSTENSVTLTWVPGFERPKTEYNVWYRATDTPEWRTTKITNLSTNQKTVSNLSPGRAYEFMVLSQDRHGDGMFSKAIRVTTKGSKTFSASTHASTPLGQFQQIGPPRNLSVTLTADGYLVTWQPPDFGSDELRTYRVRWTQAPREYIYGSAETQGTSFLVPSLEEDKTYHFEVVAVSQNDYEAASSKYVLNVPGYRQIRAVAVGVAVGIAFLLVAAGGSWYMRRLYINRLQQEEKEEAF